MASKKHILNLYNQSSLKVSFDLMAHALVVDDHPIVREGSGTYCKARFSPLL